MNAQTGGELGDMKRHSRI